MKQTELHEVQERIRNGAVPCKFIDDCGKAYAIPGPYARHLESTHSFPQAQALRMAKEAFAQPRTLVIEAGAKALVDDIQSYTLPKRNEMPKGALDASWLMDLHPSRATILVLRALGDLYIAVADALAEDLMDKERGD